MFWINSSTIKSRKQAAHWFRWGLWLYSYEDQGVSLKYDLYRYLSTYQNPADFEDFIEEFNQRLCGAAISESTVQMLKNELLGNLNDMHWEEYITAFLDDPSNDNLAAFNGGLTMCYFDFLNFLFITFTSS